MPRTPGAIPICSPEKKGCIEEALEIVEETAFDNEAQSRSNCMCLPGCTSVDYPYEVTQSKMHRAQFLDLPPDLLGEFVLLQTFCPLMSGTADAIVFSLFTCGKARKVYGS